MRYAFILAEKACWPIVVMCAVLKVSTSGFYAWLRHAPSARATKDERLKILVGESFARSRKTYGSPRVHADLAGEHVGRNRVIRIMRDEGLVARVRRRYRSTTMSEHDQPIAANLLDRDFTAAAPNQRWVGDTTELLTLRSDGLQPGSLGARVRARFLAAYATFRDHYKRASARLRALATGDTAEIAAVIAANYPPAALVRPRWYIAAPTDLAATWLRGLDDADLALA